MMNRHSETFSGSGRANTVGLLVSRGRVVAMAGALAVVPMVTGLPQGSTPAPAHPVRSHIRQVAFVKSSVAAMRASGAASSSATRPAGMPDPITTARAGGLTPVQNVAGAVTVVGVTWPKGSVSAQGQFQIRTLTGTTWTSWQNLTKLDGGPGSAPRATSGTNEYVVTGASKYQVRSLTTGAQAPTTATVQAVDPGTSAADNVEQAPGAAAAATAKPAIITRAQWGADPGLMGWTPSYGKVNVAFVHHTDGSNNYGPADAAGVVRGIYAYHAQSLGWGDIGYNFLVDRFGRIYEGRYGGMDKPVIGGHVYNYNSVSTGVSGIGTFSSAAVPQAMTDAFKRVLAWKLSVAGVPATGTSPVKAPWGTSLQRISGHRDVGGTECPGNSLYARLPEIRAGSAALMSAGTSRPAGSPFGQIDAVTSANSKVSAHGWAMDPSSARSPIMVQMYVDGRANALTWASQARPDVARVYPAYGPSHGYTLTMATTPGAHRVCLYAINTGPGSSTGLGCRIVTVSSNPFGRLDTLTTASNRVTASGWAIDPSTRLPILVQMYVDYRANALTWASKSRPDVAVAYPAYGPGHGFTQTMATTPGAHTVCLYALNTGPGANTRLSCRAVTVP